jgi:hypothetical protein
LRGRGIALAALLLALVLAACSDEAVPTAAQDAPSASPKATEEPTCPLTGEEVPPGIDVERAAVAVKVENSEEARPQSGLEHADLVYEEIVEGGITRFMAVYHCGTSKKVGPVRSARFDDPKIALPFTRVLAYSGSNKIVERELRRAKIIALNELNAGSAFFRIPPGQIAVHNLFANIDKLRAEAKGRKLEPPSSKAFEFGEAPAAAKRARAVTVNFNARNVIQYRWKGGSWKRWEAGAPFRSASGRQIGVPNVLVQQVEVNNSKTIVDSAGNPSPDIALQGKGRAWLLRDGRVIKGTWRIAKDGRAASFRRRGGAPFVFDKGPIWVELVPSPKGAVKGSVAVR